MYDNKNFENILQISEKKLINNIPLLSFRKHDYDNKRVMRMWILLHICYEQSFESIFKINYFRFLFVAGKLQKINYKFDQLIALDCVNRFIIVYIKNGTLCTYTWFEKTFRCLIGDIS